MLAAHGGVDEFLRLDSKNSEILSSLANLFFFDVGKDGFHVHRETGARALGQAQPARRVARESLGRATGARFREEARSRETAEANARELLALWKAQCEATESHNLAVKDVQNKAKFCYAAVKGALSSEAKKKIFEAQSDDSDDEAPLVTKKLPAVPLCGFADCECGVVDSNPHKTDVNKVDAQSVSDKSRSSRKSTLSQYAK